MDKFALCANGPEKSSVESWFSGVEPLLLQVLGPLFPERPVGLDKVGVAVDLRDCRGKDEQIAALFHGHLPLRACFAAAVDLAVGFRVETEGVGREGNRQRLLRVYPMPAEPTPSATRCSWP